jgi:hypothetical protein
VGFHEHQRASHFYASPLAANGIRSATSFLLLIFRTHQIESIL